MAKAATIARRHWLAVSTELALLSVASVVVHVLQYPVFVPEFVAGGLEWFVEPGVFVWWITLGGVFQAFPSTAVGYFVVVLGNTTLCLAVFAAGMLLVNGGAWLVHAMRH
jgi:hypothetical protein